MISEFFPLLIVMFFGVYLVGLAFIALARPSWATKFLYGFAASAFTHYLELFVRLMVGVALLLAAPKMMFEIVFTWFGWMLVATTVLLLAVPWRWHQRFAQQVVPMAAHYLWLLALGSFCCGSFILLSALPGLGLAVW